MKNGEYWAERFTQLEEAQNRLGAETMRDIESIYRQVKAEIDGKIALWYQRFAKNNGVTLLEAKMQLVKDDLKEFKWSVQDYIRHGEENAVDGRWIKELENASAKWHITRYEALQIQVRQSLETLFAKQNGIVKDAMEDIYRSGYYHTAFELQKGFNIGWDIAGVDQRQIEKVLVKPWAVDGKNFSERIWENKNRLIKEVHTELNKNVMLGQDPQKAINAIAKKMNVSKSNAGRLVMTEEAYFSSLAQKDCFNDLGVEQYEIVATLDSHTSEICQNMDGKHFPMADYKAGSTAPPFHPYCRSTTCPYFDDDFDSIGERAARGKDGKTYYVPADMTYKEWKAEFVDGGDKEKLTEINKMAGGGVDWSKAEPVVHSKEVQKELVEYGKSKDVNVYAVNRFDGDPDILKEQIDVISDMAKEYKIGKRITITFEKMSDDDDFARTENNTITFNTKALRNKEITNEILNSDNFLASTDIRGIAAHEMGHIISRKYGNKGVEIAKKAYYNVYGEEVSEVQLLNYVYSNISIYSASADDDNIGRRFKRKNYKELFPEVLAKQKTNPYKFTKEFVKIFKELIYHEKA